MYTPKSNSEILTAKGNVDTTQSESHKTLEKEVERMLEWEEGVELWNTALQVRLTTALWNAQQL